MSDAEKKKGVDGERGEIQFLAALEMFIVV